MLSQLTQTQADPGAISKMYPVDYCNLTEFFEFTFESISVSCNFDSNTSEIQEILSNCSGQQGTGTRYIFEIGPTLPPTAESVF